VWIGKWDCTKLKSFTQQKSKKKTYGMGGYSSYSFNKELICRIYKELKKLNNNRANNPNNK
jgi:hypothetical protein